MSRYDARTVTISVGGAGAFTFALGGNSARLTLAVNCPISAIVVVSDHDAGPLGAFWARTQAGDFFPLTYCNFGPLMQREVWVASLGAATTVFVTEIFRI